MARLKDICIINPKSPGFQDDFAVSFVPMPKVGENGEFDPSEVKTYQEVKKGFTYFQDGDVLFAKITPCMENGKGAIAQTLKNGVGFGSTEFHVLRPLPDRVTSKWLYYLLSWQAFRKEAEKNMTGSAGQKRVPKSFLEEYAIDVPDVNIQTKVTDVLDEICSLISFRKQQLAKLDELVKARFVEMFGDPVQNPLEWEAMPLLAVGTCKNGMNFHSGDSGVEIRCLGVGDFKNLSFIYDVSCLPIVSLQGVPSDDYMLQDGDIVFVRSNGNKALVGRSLAVYPGNAPITFSGFCIRFRPNHEVIETKYILMALKTASMRKKMAGRGANIQNLNQKILSELIIPVPPLVLQTQFTNFIEQTNECSLTIQQSLDKLEVLKESLMQEYFG